jgi:Skp family chaperone for outer membrane proteins
MKKSIIAFAVALSVLVTFTSSANAVSQGCTNVGTLVKAFAERRNSGFSLGDLTTDIERIAEEKSLSESDTLAAKSAAFLAYTKFKNLSPEKAQRSYIRECNKIEN